MRYTLDQTFNYYNEPNNYQTTRSNIYYNITFDDVSNWIANVFFNLKFRRGDCGDIKYLNAVFNYKFSNVSRQIFQVMQSYDNWPLLNKRPSYYSGRDPTDKEVFLIDELRLLLGSDGMIELLFDNIGTDSISLSGRSFEVIKFSSSVTLPIPYFL